MVHTSGESKGRLSTSAEATSLKTPPDLHKHIQHLSTNVVLYSQKGESNANPSTQYLQTILKVKYFSPHDYNMHCYIALGKSSL